jgi:hypothetical protein
VRRKAAEVSFGLHVPSVARQVERALAREEDEQVRRWCALALVRMGGAVPALAESLLQGGDREWRQRAAMALAERGDPRGCPELSAFWGTLAPPEGFEGADGEPARLSLDFAATRDLVSATAAAHCLSAVPSLVRSLQDVRARPLIADALGALNDPRARAPLLALLVSERNMTTRPRLARALLALGERDWSSDPGLPRATLTLSALPSKRRLIVLLTDEQAGLEVRADGAAAAGVDEQGAVRTFDLPVRSGRKVMLELQAARGAIAGVWLACTDDLIDRLSSRK